MASSHGSHSAASLSIVGGERCGDFTTRRRRSQRRSSCAALAAPSLTSPWTFALTLRASGSGSGVELAEDGGRALYVPRGFAHGFLTLADATEVAYQISTPYNPEAARGVRWDDPFYAVAWPAPVEVIAPRDRGYPDVEIGRLQELCGL